MSHVNVGVVQYRAEQNPRNNASEYPDMQIFHRLAPLFRDID